MGVRMLVQPRPTALSIRGSSDPVSHDRTVVAPLQHRSRTAPAPVLP